MACSILSALSWYFEHREQPYSARNPAFGTVFPRQNPDFDASLHALGASDSGHLSSTLCVSWDCDNIRDTNVLRPSSVLRVGTFLSGRSSLVFEPGTNGEG